MITNTFALDIGYGQTKCASRNSEGAIVKDRFPSLAPYRSHSSISDALGSQYQARDSMFVTVNGLEYEVGPGVSTTAAFGDTGRVLTDDFVTSNQYAALLAGAVYRSRHSHIDRLVLGLPVHTIHKYMSVLKERFTGRQNYGQGDFIVDKVNVIPQPIGTLRYAAEYFPRTSSHASQHLVIDVGYYTTDFIYTTDFRVDDKRSGGRPGGASQIVERIAKSIAKKHGCGDAVYDIERIDECLRKGHPFNYFGEQIDLRTFLPEANAVIEDVMREVKRKVGIGEGLNSIILSGGGSDLYEHIVRETYPRTQIAKIQDPSFANAIGFLLAGETNDQPSK